MALARAGSVTNSHHSGNHSCRWS